MSAPPPTGNHTHCGKPKPTPTPNREQSHQPHIPDFHCTTVGSNNSSRRRGLTHTPNSHALLQSSAATHFPQGHTLLLTTAPAYSPPPEKPASPLSTSFLLLQPPSQLHSSAAMSPRSREELPNLILGPLEVCLYSFLRFLFEPVATGGGGKASGSTVSQYLRKGGLLDLLQPAEKTEVETYIVLLHKNISYTFELSEVTHGLVPSQTLFHCKISKILNPKYLMSCKYLRGQSGMERWVCPSIGPLL